MRVLTEMYKSFCFQCWTSTTTYVVWNAKALSTAALELDSVLKRPPVHSYPIPVEQFLCYCFSSQVAQCCSLLLPNAWNWVFLSHNCVFTLFLKCSPLTRLWAHQFSSYPPHHYVSSTLPRWGYILGEEHWNAAQQLLGFKESMGGVELWERRGKSGHG